MTRLHKQRFYQLHIVVLILITGLLCGQKVKAAQIQETVQLEEGLPIEEAVPKETEAILEQYEIGWGQNVSLKGLFDSSSLYMQIGEWDVREAMLTLEMSASQLLNREVSYVTVSLDGQPVETIYIPENRTERMIYRIPLPAELMNETREHTITADAYLRGQTTDACVDDSSVSTWLNISGKSRVELWYEPLLECENIAGFYEKFTSIEALKNECCMAAVGKDAPDSALTAMAYILSGIAGHAEGDYEQITTGLIESESDFRKADYLLYVDGFEQLPQKLRQSLSSQQQEYAKTGALICLLTFEDTKVLLVTGNNDTALSNAGRLLSNHEKIAGLTGIQEQIDADRDYREAVYEWDEYIPLTDSGMQVKGNFEQSASFWVDCPTDRKLAESAQLSLEYRYSANLDFDKSLLTVYIDNIPIGSRALTEKGADGTTEVFNIPQDINAVGSFIVETRFALYPKGDWCEETPENIPWAYIADTSMLKWSTMEQTEVFFEYYPFPFLKNGTFSETKILLPAQWNKADFRVMAETMLTMGSWQKSNAGEMEVLTDSRKAEGLSGFNIISIGNKENNPWNTEFLQISANLGYAGLLLEEDTDMLHAVLVITGARDSDMLKAMTFLGSRADWWKLSGDRIQTNGEDVSCSYIRTPEVKEAAPIKTVPEISNNNVPLIIVCSVLVLILLSAAMLLIKYGRKRDEE